MGLSLRGLGRSVADWFSADSDEDQRKRMAAGQPRYYAQQQQQRPNYGGGVSGVKNRVKDVFDANTQQDYWRRNQGLSQLYSEQNKKPTKAPWESYKDQQIGMGNARPFENLGSQLLGNTARFLNTGKAAIDEVADTSRMLVADATGNMDALDATNQRIKERQQRQYQPDSGLMGVGTIFDNPEEFNTLGATDLAKRVGFNTLGTASEVLPFAKVARPGVAGAQVLSRGGAPITNRVILAANAAERGVAGRPARVAFNAAQDAVTGGAESVARQYAQTGQINPITALGDIGSNVVLGQAQPAGTALVGNIPRTAYRQGLPNERPSWVSPNRKLADQFKREGTVRQKFTYKAKDVLDPSDPVTRARLVKKYGEKKISDMTSGTARGRFNDQVEGEARRLAKEMGFKSVAFDETLDAADARGIKRNPMSINVLDTDSLSKPLGLGASTQRVDAAGNTIDMRPGERPKATLKEDEIPTINSPTKSEAEIARDANGGAALDPDWQRVNPDDPFNNRKPLAKLKNEFGRTMIDEDSEMINFLRRAEKDTGKKGLVDDWLFNTGNQRASSSIANAKMRQDPEFKAAFKGLDSTEAAEFDNYIAARAELKNYEGLPTTRTKADLETTVSALAPKYEKRFESFNQFTKSPLKDMYEAGIIDQPTFEKWSADNDYVRIQRNMDDLVGFDSASRSRSLGSTSTKQKRTGSKRDILSPSQTGISRRQQLQSEIQRNKTATATINALAEMGLANKVPEGKNKNVIKRLVNGQPEFWEVPKDIKRVVDNVNPYQLGVLAKIVSTPARVFRAGTTALSAPFTVTNYLRDQASSAIYSKQVLATHAPQNIISGLAQASKDFGTLGKNSSEAWDKFITYAGDQTIFDELRNVKDSKKFLREARRGGTGKAFNMVTSPIRSLEDLNSITEKATRFQNFKGIYESTLKKTGNQDEAIKAAVLAARQNSVDFQRAGSVGRVLNMFIPYFNAGIQGSRNVARSFRDRPVGTTAKSVAFVAAPAAVVTAINMGGVLNPDSREIYESIPEFEKKDNFIVILPGAKQRDDGRWEGIVKIPKPQGYRELTDPTREITEAYLGGESPENAALIAKDMLSAFTGPINTDTLGQFGSSITPAFAKPIIQQQANKDLYTGGKIVPDFMVEGTEDPTKRAYKGTSGTAREIAKAIGVEPVRVEKFIEDTFGSLGRYGLNASDNAVKKATGNEDFVVGGRSMKSDFSRRMFEAGGELLDKNKSAGRKFFESRTRAIEKVGLNRNEQAAYDSLHPDKTNFLGEDIFDENKRVSKYTKAGAYLQFPKTFEVDKMVDAEQRKNGSPGNPLFDLKGNQLNKVLLKQALPPGAKDQELDNLYKQEWYQDYQNANSKYYTQVKERMAQEGKVMPKSKNPYPTTPKDLQQVMDTYSALPKGTGARSAWIRANPQAFKRMTDQWGAVDAWENKERKTLGLDPLTDEESSNSSGYGKYGSGGGFGSRKKSAGSVYKYAINPNAGGEVAKPKVTVKKGSGKVVARRKAIKPKVSVKRSKV